MQKLLPAVVGTVNTANFLPQPIVDVSAARPCEPEMRARRARQAANASTVLEMHGQAGDDALCTANCATLGRVGARAAGAG